MEFGWLEITVAAIVISLILGVIFTRGSSWIEPRFWKNIAIVTSLVMVVFLLILTFDTLASIKMGTNRVPAATVINKKISYVYDEQKRWYVPKIGGEQPLFGKIWSEEEAMALLNKGKMTIQSKACMDCHTLLGNGGYYAPDLTKAWLDPKWNLLIKDMVGANSKEEAIAKWIQHSDQYPTFQRKMPNLGITDEEAKAIVAYLKWMAAIDTNGFPDNFKTDEQ